MSVTYSEAKTKIEQDLDLEDEVFIQDPEMLAYFNDALREAEKEVLTIYEDYLLAKTYLPLVLNQSAYSLPTGIMANKIRGIVYSQSDIVYEITRIRDKRKFLEIELLKNANPTDYYKYYVLNESTTGIQIELVPASKETSSTNVIVHYIRKVDAVVDDTDIVDKDIPESIDFVYAYVKARCKQKENGGVMPQDAAAELEQQRKMLVDTLTDMIPDDDNEVIKDMTFYEEMS
jgi:hypothetical protein